MFVTNRRSVIVSKERWSVAVSLVAVIVEWVVAGEGQEHAETRTQREEDLGSCINPHLGVGQTKREESDMGRR